MTTTPHTSLDAARDRALEVRALYEVMERRLNGREWSTHELMLGFLNDTGYIGRLVLADAETGNSPSRR